MPNWVKNVVALIPENAPIKITSNKFWKKFITDGQFDFNKLIPMPDEIRNAKDDSWYRWCIDNWGTKWNSNETFISNGVLCFQTAWSTPAPIWERLNEEALKYGYSIYAEYADEDIGYNCGEICYINKTLRVRMCAEPDEDFAVNVWNYGT